MASSGVTTFTLTVQELIDLSLIDIGALPVGETPTSNEMSDAIRRLNLLIKSLENKHIKLFKTDTQELSLVGSTQEYTLDADTYKLLNAYITVDNTDIPLNILSWEDYDEIGAKTAGNVPTDMVVQYNSAPPTVLFYPVPTEAYTVTYRREALIESVTDATETFDIPNNLLPALQKGLSYYLANSYQLPLEERMLLKGEFREELMSFISKNTQRLPTDIVQPRGVAIV